MASVFGENIKISIFGQSHSRGIGVCIDGIPAGEKIDPDQLQEFMDRRAPGRNEYSTPRKEADRPEILSGLAGDVTCGAPFAAVIYNTDTRSGDYSEIRDIPRPAHADFAARAKFHGYEDTAGGGHFSARLTAPLCIAGGIFKQLLSRRGIEIGAHISSIGGIEDKRFNSCGGSEELERIGKPFPVIDEEAGAKMRELIQSVKAEGDSVGGRIECMITGVPSGIGDPMFDGLENRISQAVFAVPAVKGIEFGCGFDVCSMRGSENNDPFYAEDGVIRSRTNNHGGILGGISSGMPVVFSVAMKPTPSIAKEQDSVSMSGLENTKLKVRGRHDPCIVPRAVPCIEAAAAIAIYDAFLGGLKYEIR